MKNIWYENEIMHVILTPEYIKQKSFYNKAYFTIEGNNMPFYVLYSYNTPVLTYDFENNNVRILDKNLLSNTTLKHIKEFLLQHSCKAGAKQELIEMYYKG